MTERWQQIEKICQSALELEESRRGEFLEEACGADAELRREVESLLRFDKRGDRFIEQPALEAAARMIAQEKPESLLGQQVGSYQIQSLLGAGGMGVVYKGRDVRLNRSVVIKVLPANKVSDPERKRRFVQEAKAASALNHPNIITIYDIGSESGIDFIVMEYVVGKTLDQRIPRKGMKLNEALKLSMQMADALAKAHAAGIIHRDLKPTNVMATDEGLVKVLDFGLAKLTEVSESGEEATLTLQSQTEEGTIIGTLSYMSPEQAEGRKVDARSDIFSFGAVLYEMVTGQKAFEGDSKLSTLAAIANKNPKPVIEINPILPRELDRIINHCLRKDPARRFQHMDDLKVDLEELKEEFDSGKLAGTSPTVRPVQRSWVWATAALVVGAIVVSTWMFRGTARKPASGPKVIPLTSYPGFESSPSFSPDGNQVAFSWNGEKQDNYDIYIKQIGSSNYVRLTKDPADDVSPAFSSDGRSIGFIRTSNGHSTFIVIPAIGGHERIVAEVPNPPDPLAEFNVRPSFAWFPDGKWAATDGLKLLSRESGETVSLTSSPPKTSFDYSPAVAPNGRTVAFSRWTGSFFSETYLLDLTEDLKPKGEPRRLTSLKGLNLRCAWTPNSQEIVFSSFFFGPGMSLWKVRASGATEPEQLPFDIGEASQPAISPVGNQLAYERELFDSNIWRLSLSASGTALAPSAPLIASTRRDAAAQYSPDGKHIAFESWRSGDHGLWVSDADGSDAVELLVRAGSAPGTPRWSPDGKYIAFDLSPEGNTDIYIVRASGGQPIRLTSHLAYDAAPSWSRDGKWIYFTSTRSGRYEVWKVLAEGGEAEQVTRNGGGTAFESADGKWVYYIKGDYAGSLFKMPVGGGEESQVLPSVVSRAFSLVKDGIYFIAKPAADGKYHIQFLSYATNKVKTVAAISRPPNEGLSVSPDGRSLLFAQDDEAGSDLMLVENFR
jgi:serine/threonine protein kinase